MILMLDLPMLAFGQKEYWPAFNQFFDFHGWLLLWKFTFSWLTAGYTQLIEQRTYLTEGPSSYIDQFFTANINSISASGIEQSLRKAITFRIWLIKFQCSFTTTLNEIRLGLWKSKVDNIQFSISSVDRDFVFQRKGWCLTILFQKRNPNRKECETW